MRSSCGAGRALLALVLFSRAGHAEKAPPAPSAAGRCVPADAAGRCTAGVCCAVCPDPTDCTKPMQAALDSPTAHTIVFGPRTWITQPLHVTRNHTTLLFQRGALVLAKEGSFHGINVSRHDIAGMWVAFLACQEECNPDRISCDVVADRTRCSLST